MAATGTSTPSLTEADFHNSIHSGAGTPSKKYQRTGHGKNKKVQLVSKSHRCDWADSLINLSTKTVKISVYLNYQQGSLSSQKFNRLKKLSSSGISDYWSRTILVDQTQFKVFVNVLERKTNGIDVKLKENKSSKYARSHNSGIIDATFVYNEGFYSQNLGRADKNFSLVAAHEFGHSVLSYFGGTALSWGHKGSTHAVTQSVKSTTPGYPSSGEIDLMKYYDHTKNVVPESVVLTNTRAHAKDVMRLIWMSNVTFIK